MQAAKEGKIVLAVSLHTLEELKDRNDSAYQIAKELPELPHWSIGSWHEQVGNWKQNNGSWDDGKFDDQRQEILRTLAKSGNDIRDRGTFIDALRNEFDGFITSNNQLVKPGPLKRINDYFSTKVISPENLVKELSLK